MMRLIEYKDIDRAEWGALVAASTTGTWFQSPEAYDFYASLPELFRPFAIGLACNPAGAQTQLRGVCVGYVTVEKSAFKQFLTRRAIIIGGPCLANDATNEEVQFLMEAVRKELRQEAIYIETRNFNDYSKWKDAFEKAGFKYKEHLNFHVDCQDEKLMWERLSDNRKRQVRKGDSVEDALLQSTMVTEEEIREWYAVLANLYRTKVKTPLWPVEFFIEAYRKRVGKFLLVKHEGKVIGGNMVVTDGKSVYEWFECGLNAEYKEQYPSVMATWAGMTLALETGCARYDMMGAGEPGVPYGVRDFKSEFGGDLVEHGRFLCVNKPMLYRLGKLGVKILKRK
jgi:hypothetical protein